MRIIYPVDLPDFCVVDPSFQAAAMLNPKTDENMVIRLFTAGTHKGLSFSNEQIDRIAADTAAGPLERIPIVLGHPKNDLPVLGYLPKAAIRKYREGEKTSIGFARGDAELADEAMEAIRALGRNKISIRLQDGKVKHIGLVRDAAVEENNAQDFAALTGDFAALDDLEEKRSEGGALEFIKNLFKTTNKTDFSMEKKEEKKNEEKLNADFAALKDDVAKIGEAVEKLSGMITGQEGEKRKAALTADFAKAEYSHLTDEQKAKAVDFCAKMTDEADVEAYKAMLQAGNKKEKPTGGSKALDFGKKTGDEKTAEDLIREQIAGI
ncbi:MAG: hypothetical protein LBR65_03865 [Culturomica sp.]|jgi:hypothetical protein|nr:hypothetical protein [Culturomica sp.]